MNTSVRTIITYSRDDGTSAMQEEQVGQALTTDDRGKPMYSMNLLWGTGQPGSPEGGKAGAHGRVVDPFFPPSGAHRFVICSFLPESAFDEHEEVSRLPGFLEVFDGSGQGMHTTASIDYTYLISGDLTLVLDDGEVDLTPGDCVVQRGTRHAWRNKGSEPAIVAAVLIAD